MDHGLLFCVLFSAHSVCVCMCVCVMGREEGVVVDCFLFDLFWFGSLVVFLLLLFFAVF